MFICKNNIYQLLGNNLLHLYKLKQNKKNKLLQGELVRYYLIVQGRAVLQLIPTLLGQKERDLEFVELLAFRLGWVSTDVLESTEDGLWYWRSNGDVATLGLETVLIGGVAQLHLLTLGRGVGEAALSTLSSALFVGVDTVLGFVAGITISTLDIRTE